MGPLRHPGRSAGCARFRGRLMQAVLDADALAPLSWDAHLVSCAACRALIESEEQLDELLAAWPAPRLDAAMRERLVGRVAAERALDAVLARDAVEAQPEFAARILAAVRRRLLAAAAGEGLEARLDALLERHAPSSPAGLGTRTAAAVRERLADASLDALLERDALHAPVGLAARTRAALRNEPRVPNAATSRRRLALVRVVGATAAAAAVLAIAWLVHRDAGGPADQSAPLVVQEAAQRAAERSRGASDAAPVVDAARVDERLLGELELLEEVEVLLDGDLELLLSTMDSSDEALLDLDADEAPTTTESPSKG